MFVLLLYRQCLLKCGLILNYLYSRRNSRRLRMALALRLNETCSSVRRVSSLEAGSSTAAIIDPWQNALSMFKKSLPVNHLNEIETRTTPGDIVVQVKEWEELHQKGRRARLTRAFEACINRVERFSAAIDQLAQGSGEPACLLWGCIKFVLVVSSFSPDPLYVDSRYNKPKPLRADLFQITLSSGRS